MITSDDFVHLPYTADLTEAGILYALQMLPRRFPPAGRRPYHALRRAVGATALHLAVRRELTARKILFEVSATSPFFEPERYDIAVGGRKCELKGYLVSRREQIQAIAAEPDSVLSAQALVPLERHLEDPAREDAVYLFAFVCAETQPDGRAGADPKWSQRPSWWLHAMPPGWMHWRSRAPAHPLALRSDAPEVVRLTLAGEDSARAFMEVTVDLPPRQTMRLEAPLQVLSCLHCRVPPAGRIGIRLPSRQISHIVHAGQWHNLWLEGRDICLVGWMPRQEFRRRAKLVPEGRRVFQFDRTRTKNLAVDVRSLKPVQELFDLALGGQR